MSTVIASTPPKLTPTLVWLMAFSTGLAVAGNYYAQPLLPTIAHQMGISIAGAGSIVTTAQLGYAAGLLLLVPLGDLFERRRLIVTMTVLSALGLLLTATAGSMGALLTGTLLSGMFSVVAQLLVPLAATLAEAKERGRVLGTVMSGLLLGILLARTASGALAGIGGWRSVYWVGALAMLLTAGMLARQLPRYRQSAGLSYPQLLLSVLRLFREEPSLRIHAFLGATSFAAFSVLWTSMAFLLAAPPYGFSTVTIGLFGLVGAAGALAAPVIGRLGDRGRGHQVTLWGLILLFLSWLPLSAAQHSLVALVIGVLLLDLMVQAVNVSNQAAIYRLRPDARNRLTSAYMTSYFIGGATGSLASTAAYQHAGWNGVCLIGALVCALGLLAWLLVQRKA